MFDAHGQLQTFSCWIVCGIISLSDKFSQESVWSNIEQTEEWVGIQSCPQFFNLGILPLMDSCQTKHIGIFGSLGSEHCQGHFLVGPKHN